MKLFLLSALLTGSLVPGPPGVQSGGESGFQWIRGDRIDVAYQGADSLRAVQIRTFLEGLPPLVGLPDSLPTHPSLYIVPDQATLDAMTGGIVPEWSAGVAVPSQNRILVPGFGVRRARGWDEARVLRHEWAHLGLHQYLSGLRVPQWFDEGYAEWASGGWSPGEGWRLRVALALGRAPPLDSLTLGWPRDQASAGLAYLLSATAVEYLIQESGVDGLRLFFQRWNSDQSFDQAMRGVYGLTVGQFEEDWKGYVKGRYGWLFVLSHSSVLWLTLALALLLLFRVRRGRDREALARLRAGEPPEVPAYWQETGEEAVATEEGRPGEGSGPVGENGIGKET